MAAVTLITQADYARRRGVSQVAVLKAIRDGRITTVARDGRVWIDPEVADIQWQKNTKDKHRPLSSIKTLPLQTPAVSSALSDVTANHPSPGIAADTAINPAQSVYDRQMAAAKREHHEANLAAMREAKEAGQLIDRDSVTKAVIDAGAALRSALERLPGLAVELAAMTEEAPIRERLNTAVQNALLDFYDSLHRLSDDDEASMASLPEIASDGP